MGQLIQVQVGHYRPVQFFDLNDIPCSRNDCVVLQVENNNYEFGRVVSDLNAVCKTKTESIGGKVVRKATDGDLKQIQNNEMKAKDALNHCVRKINERKLDMQIVKAEYTFDSSKIIFLFTAEGRVDFRNLVKDLAKVFRVRIELKQIGVRDRSKVVGGFGVCGRELCCSSFLHSFHNLSIKMAKEQGLPLNPSRISGVCGRIKCCMAYEFVAYKDLARDLPKVGDKITLENEKGRVIDVNILKRFVTVEMAEGRIIRREMPKKQPDQVPAV